MAKSMYEFDVSKETIEREYTTRKSKFVKHFQGMAYATVGIWKNGEPWRRVDLVKYTPFDQWSLWTPSILLGKDEVTRVLAEAGYITA